MAVNPDYRNQHTRLETGKRGKKVMRFCKDCGAGLVGYKRLRCGPCDGIKISKNRTEQKRRSRLRWGR